MSQNEIKPSSKLLDPFLNLSLPSPASSLCFLSDIGGKFDGDDDDGSNSDSDSSEELTFRTSLIQKNAPSKVQNSYKRQNLLKNRLLVSCHKNGEALLWDCGRQTKIASTISSEGAAGMTVKRIDGNNNMFLYQTRDSKGTVAIHSIDRVGASNEFSVIRTYETYSMTFCQAAPCRGNSNLIAVPSRQESTASVMDARDPKPAYVTSPISNGGMVTSLAMSVSSNSGSPILACGMEGGSVIFYDFASGRSIKGTCQLTKDPILALDIAPSEASKSNETQQNHSSVVAVAGMAGDTVEVAELPQAEQGRVALLKATTASNDHSWDIRTRARLSTCRVEEETSFGKPGVAICRFRPQDARIFAVGGWDNRVRLFDRSKGAPMGILRGHVGSVNALDWAPDAADSGLLATAGGDDSCISFWQCFGKAS